MPVKTDAIVEELRQVVRRPRRIMRFVSPRARREFLYRVNPPSLPEWSGNGQGWKAREYESYEQYVKHQASKLGIVHLTEYDTRFREALRQRMSDGPIAWRGRSVLCLGARIGTEVRAFHDLGAFAVGIDLNPGRNNSMVLVGDFHHLQFADASVEAIYTNCLDHALDLRTVLAEMRRVLKPSGCVVVEAQRGATEGEEFDDWAATSWDSVDGLVELFAREGFDVDRRTPFAYPWEGDSIIFRRPEPERTVPE